MLRNATNKYLLRNLQHIIESSTRFLATGPIDFPDMGPPIPEYENKIGEETEVKRARLLYQSRKRGMSENGLLLSNFAGRYLKTFDSIQLDEFDHLINKPSNDWDLFYWMLEKEETPKEYDTPIMNMLKEFCKNEDMEERYQQPNLEPIPK